MMYSFVVGFFLGTLSVLLVNFINGHHTQGDKKLSLLLLKRAKRDYFLILLQMQVPSVIYPRARNASFGSSLPLLTFR